MPRFYCISDSVARSLGERTRGDNIDGQKAQRGCDGFRNLFRKMLKLALYPDRCTVFQIRASVVCRACMESGDSRRGSGNSLRLNRKKAV